MHPPLLHYMWLAPWIQKSANLTPILCFLGTLLPAALLCCNAFSSPASESSPPNTLQSDDVINGQCLISEVKTGGQAKDFWKLFYFSLLNSKVKVWFTSHQGGVGNLLLLALGRKLFFMGSNHFYKCRPRNNINLHKVGDTESSVSQSLKL